MGGQGAPKSPAQSVPPKSPAPTTPIDISMTFSDPQTETAQAQKLYEAVVSAKRQCGEPLDDFTFPRFHRILSEQSAKIKSQLNCSRVVFSVHVENGRVKFVGKGA